MLKLDWISPGWHAPVRVQAVCTTRAGGVSVAPFDSLNLGDHVGDTAANVVANRSILQHAVAAKPVFLKQVHGTRVVRLTREAVDEAANITANGTENVTENVTVGARSVPSRRTPASPRSGVSPAPSWWQTACRFC